MSPETRLAPIVCAMDDAYVLPLRTLIRSIAAAHPSGAGDLRLIVLDQGIAPAGAAAIRQDAETFGLSIELRPIPELTHLPVSGVYTTAIYGRLSIPEAIPEERRVLYMDVDTLVLSDLRPLLGLDLHGHPIGASRDSINPLIGLGPGLPGWAALGLPRGRPYFSSGVMLLDLDRVRDSRLFARAAEFLVEHTDKVHFWDQDALNYVADGDWLRIDSRWNTFAMSYRGAEYTHPCEEVNPLAGLIEDEKSAAVIHYAGRRKPWRDDFPDCGLRELYRGFQPTAREAVG